MLKLTLKDSTTIQTSNTSVTTIGRSQRTLPPTTVTVLKTVTKMPTRKTVTKHAMTMVLWHGAEDEAPPAKVI